MNALGALLLILLLLTGVSAAIGYVRSLRIARMTVLEYQRGALFVDGSLREMVGPGRYWTWSRRTLTLVDMRLQMLQVPGQEILMADGISLKLTAAGTFRIVDPRTYLLASLAPTGVLYQEAQQALRESVAGMRFEDLLQTRTTLNERMPALLQNKATALGIEMVSLEVRDMVLPAELKKAFAQALTAQKEGVAALERARAETASLRSLANAARLLQDHPGLLQLRALQTMESSKGNALTLRMDDGRSGPAQS